MGLQAYGICRGARCSVGCASIEASLSANEWFWNLTKREGDVLRLSRVAAPRTEVRNLSQSIGRAHGNTLQESGKHVAPTMLPGQLLWSESQSRPVTGAEALIFQGFPALRFLKNVARSGSTGQQNAFLRQPHDRFGWECYGPSCSSCDSTSWLGFCLLEP